MWTEYFDGIYLINLTGRPERLAQAYEELGQYNIRVDLFKAIQCSIPAFGVFASVKHIFRLAKFRGQKRILIFEDDALFDQPPGPTMELCIKQLADLDWDLFYLGPNTHQDFPHFTSPNILPVYNSFALHAVAYSESGMEKINSLKWDGTALDVMIAHKIQPHNKCYCSYPLLATQRSGFSDIQKKNMDQSYIKERYYKHVSPLLKK